MSYAFNNASKITITTGIYCFYNIIGLFIAFSLAGGL